MSTALALVLATTAMAQGPVPTKEDVDRVTADSSTYRSYPEGAVVEWERDLRRGLAQGKPQSAADAIADAYGFSQADSRRLVNAWIVVNARHHYTRGDQRWRQAVRAELLALAPTVRRAPVGLTILAETLDQIEECAPADFDALIAGSDDPAVDAYRIAAAAPCDGHFGRALLAAPDRATATLIRWLDWGSVPALDQIAAYTWLTSPDGLARISTGDRPATAALLRQRYLTRLLAHGFVARALAFLDGLPPAERAAVLSALPPPDRVSIDRIVLTVDPEAAKKREDDAISVIADEAEAAIEAIAEAAVSGKPDLSASIEKYRTEPKPPLVATPRPSPAPIVAIAEALALAGREAEARALLATLPDLADMKKGAACDHSLTGDDGPECKAVDDSRTKAALFLDHWLNARQDDPYPLAETLLIPFSGSETPAGAVITCRLFPVAIYPGICKEDQAILFAGARFERASDEREKQFVPALSRVVPDFNALRAAVQQEVTAPPRPASPERSRSTVIAISPGFVEKPLPEMYRSKAPAEPTAGLTPLPEGFRLVRAERNGKRAIAISLSTALDPTGEVSRGGYWVHLSEDGGKTWQRPLYTGLADRFPYVVPQSTMPLLAGDMLHLAVNIAELDTASITYPPVALQTRRRLENLYLEIPITRLKQDSDGDGLTDLAAHHLLLDRPKSAAGTPFIIGSDAASCGNAPPPSLQRRASIALLDKLTNAGGGALVEPLDRPPGEIATGWERNAGVDGSEPVFLVGRPADFACLRTTRPMIVYDKADVAELERFTPDFHPIELPPIIFNRAGDRGFVNWSVGWAGGTYRFRLVNGEWKIDSISEWIT